MARIPDIGGTDDVDEMVRKLAAYFSETIQISHDFQELKNAVYGRCLKSLVKHLVDNVHNEGVACALLALRWHFASLDDSYGSGLNETRALACEIVAWRFVAHLTELESIDYLCYELPETKGSSERAESARLNGSYSRAEIAEVDERLPLLDGTENVDDDSNEDQDDDLDESIADDCESFSSTFAGLNALEIAAVADAKEFLSQKPVQRVINGIWKGDIVFWDTLSTHSEKKARIYNRDRSDPFCRLRVPLYLKIFEIIFFASLLALYYAVLVEESPINTVTGTEVVLYVWLAAFSYNELGEFWDAGTTFYATDFWSYWDLWIIVTGAAFFICRMIGIAQNDQKITSVAFDILSVEALFLVPRICSLLSLHPYFGMLLPALKEMTKDFIKFIGLVAILYVGFDTTFTFLARGKYTFRNMNWLLVKVFFGSGYLGFDAAEGISPILGPPLMLIFVCLTNILLITSLISLLSASLTKVMDHARDEYLLVYSIFVLEAASSNRLTFFYLPFNLLPLLTRPLRLFLSIETLRSIRIVLLKATHWPFVACILGYEALKSRLGQYRNKTRSSRIPKGPTHPAALRRPLLRRSMQSKPLIPEAQISRMASEPRANGAPVPTPAQASLETLVEDLRAQVQELSTIVTQQSKLKGISQ